MSREASKFRLNEPREQQEWQEEVARKFGIEHDAEFFKVPIKKPDGTTETHYISKHSGQDPTRMEIKGFKDPVDRKEVIEAVQKIFPEMYARGENPNLTEAIRELRNIKK